MRRLPLLLLAAAAVAGCRGGTSEEPPVLAPSKVVDHYIVPTTNMNLQPKFQPQGRNDFFPDGSDNRLPPENTVARGALKADPAFYRGVDESGAPVTQYPVELTAAMLRRGQERYDIYCAPCHDRTGQGQGLVPRRGWIPPPSFHDARLRAFVPGQIFDVITRGVRTMPAYARQIPEADRWAIVAYVQALQRAGYATLDDVPADQRSNLR